MKESIMETVVGSGNFLIVGTSAGGQLPALSVLRFRKTSSQNAKKSQWKNPRSASWSQDLVLLPNCAVQFPGLLCRCKIPP
jgi:hypothetical protein